MRVAPSNSDEATRKEKKKLQKPVPIKIKKIKLTEVKPCIYSGQHDSYSFIILTPLLFIDA